MVSLAISDKGKLEQRRKKMTEGGCNYLVKKIPEGGSVREGAEGKCVGLVWRKNKKAHPVVEKSGVGV